MKYLDNFLYQLLNTPSPTGYTDKAILLIERELKKLQIKYKKTLKGGLVINIDGTNPEKTRAVSAHVDTLGAMVRSITKDGYIEIDRIGGYPWSSIEGNNVVIETFNSKQFKGTIIFKDASAHAYGSEHIDDTKRSHENMVVRLDERVKSSEDVKSLGIKHGDYVFIDPKPVFHDNGFINSRHLDDKAGVAVLLQVLHDIREQHLTLPFPTTFIISVYEEVGHGVSGMIDSQIDELIAVDMAVVGSNMESDEYSVTICTKDSSGPYDRSLIQKLIQLAEDEDIQYHTDIYPFYGSDASIAQRIGYDLKTALIGPGIHASHSYERTHRDSLEATVNLLKAYLLND